MRSIKGSLLSGSFYRFKFAVGLSYQMLISLEKNRKNVLAKKYLNLICGIRMGIVLLISLIFVFVEQWFSGKILPVAAGRVVVVAVVLTGNHYFNLESYGMKLHVISLWTHPCPAVFVWLAVYGILLVILSVLVYKSFRIHN